ncbi:MAG: hypothetical protein ABI886_09150 [Betaproteobacteria bacterium]
MQEITSNVPTVEPAVTELAMLVAQALLRLRSGPGADSAGDRADFTSGGIRAFINPPAPES